jgi:hypothetical protein
MRNVLSVYAVIALLSLLIVSQAISLVSANPWFTAKQIDPPPEAIPPIITINSPQSNTIYSGAFNVSFNIKGARYVDLSKYINYFSDVYDVTYIIDNESVTIPHNADVLAIGHYDTSFVAPTLAAGNHSLTVKARGIVYNFNYLFYMDSSSQVYFVTSENNGSTSDNTATPPAQSIVPSSTLGQTTTSDYLSNPITSIAIASVIVILVVVSLSLVYFKKHKSNTELVKKP